MDGHWENELRAKFRSENSLAGRTGTIVKDITKIVCIGFIWLRRGTSGAVMWIW